MAQNNIRPLETVRPQYDFLMGYYTGVQKKWWYGIEGITFIFMGGWSDPLIGYKSWAVNVYEIEDPMWDIYNEEYPAPPVARKDAYREYEDRFEEFMRENRYKVFEMLDEIIEAWTAPMPALAS